MDHKKFLIVKKAIIIAVVLMLFLCGCGPIAHDGEKIKVFKVNEELIKRINNKYDITIPEDSVFKDGYYIFTLRDSDLVLLFDVKIENEYEPGQIVLIEDIKKLLDAKEKVLSFYGYGTIEYFGITFPYGAKIKTEEFSVVHVSDIFYDQNNDKRVYLCIKLYSPPVDAELLYEITGVRFY